MTSQSATSLEEYRADVEHRLGDIVLLLSSVSYGDLSVRLNVDLPDDTPMGAVYRGINDAVEALDEAQRRWQASQTELEDKLRMIEAQRMAIRDLSTPIIEVWEGVLCLPVVGVLDTARSAEMTESLLQTVSDKGSRYAIIDVTGIDVMDTAVAGHFLRMTRAIGLLGARCSLTGIQPRIAQTMVAIGLELRDVSTFRTLRDALEHYVADARNAPALTWKPA